MTCKVQGSMPLGMAARVHISLHGTEDAGHPYYIKTRNNAHTHLNETRGERVKGLNLKKKEGEGGEE